MKSVIGARIRELRGLHKPPWTMNRLAVEAQVDPAQLSRAERGLAGLSIDTLGRVADCLGVSLAQLIDPNQVVGHADANSREKLLDHVMMEIMDELEKMRLSECSPSERRLIQHHVRSAVEEGVRRAQVMAERELALILERP